jgi:tetratricopeptide (TPR) repeat protein
VPEAIAEYREAIRLKPDDAVAHTRLGAILCDVKHDYSGAEAAFREAIRLEPDDAWAHFCLGNALLAQGKQPEAIVAYREAIRLKPDDAGAHANLGLALRSQGELAEALAAFRRAAELTRSDSQELAEIRERVRQLERLVSLAGRLPAVLDGMEQPANPGERLDFARLCSVSKRYAAAARLWDDAFAVEPGLAEDLEAADRYNAACSAARAGAGKGERESPLDERAKARWRKKAVEWLEADLARRAKQARAGTPAAQAEVARALGRWKFDRDLAGIRDAIAVGSLPADEQAACRALWSEVDALLARMQAGRP